jgi:hypothetical protein
LSALNEYVAILKPIEVIQIEQSKISAKTKARFIELAAEYNSYVHALTQTFLHYDAVITSLEELVK